jgi:hypothetical protein
MHCPSRAVLVGDGRAEQGHHAIAGVLVDRALEPVHLGRDALEAAVDDLVHLVRVEPLGHGREAREVGEEDGDLAALPFEGAAGGEDLLGQVPGRVALGHPRTRSEGLRRRRWRPPCEGCPTLAAEGKAGWILKATLRAAWGQLRAAAAAKIHAFRIVKPAAGAAHERILRDPFPEHAHDALQNGKGSLRSRPLSIKEGLGSQRFWSRSRQAHTSLSKLNAPHRLH